MTKLTLRQATTADCELINSLATTVFPTTYKDILSAAQLDYMMNWMYHPKQIEKQITQEGHVYFIAFNEEVACGYLSVQQQSKGDEKEQQQALFHLQKIYVMPNFQGMGVGKFLFEQAIKYIKSIHPDPCIMELNVNRYNKAVLFYERMGMRKLREGDFDIGNGYYMNDYIMGLELMV